MPFPKKGIKKAQKKSVRKKKIQPEPEKPENVLPIVHRELMDEMQAKYTGLFNLSKKTSHKLLNELAITVFQRLKQLKASNPAASAKCTLFSQAYRTIYPHFADFQFILSTLHRLQDAAGAPRAQINEKDLMTVTANQYLYDNIPHRKVQEACNKYTDKVIKKVQDHINNLDTEPMQLDSQEDMARKKIRMELKNMVEFMPSILTQIATKHFMPHKYSYSRIWLYGEPKLPTRELMQPVLHQYQVKRLMRSTWMYNHLKFNIPPEFYGALMAMDGTVFHGSKLVIRNRDAPRYRLPEALLKQLMGNYLAKLYMDVEKQEMDLEDPDEEDPVDDDKDE